MHAALFGTVPAYGVFLVLAIVVGAAVGVFAASRGGVPPTAFLRLAALLIPVGLAGAKAYSLVERDGIPLPARLELTQGYRYPGAIIAMGVLFALGMLLPRMARTLVGAVPPLALADVIAPALAVAMAVSRLGCYLAGCCFGVVSSLPWSVRFPVESLPWYVHLARGWITAAAPLSLPVHPLQLYFCLWSLAVAVGLLWFQPRKKFDGQLVLVYLAVHELGKFGLESLRDDHLPHVRLISLALALSAASLLVLRSVRLRGAHDVGLSKESGSTPPPV